MGRQRLVQRREELGLTQQRVAEALRCDTKTYGRYERGETLPRVGHRPALARVLQWSVADLMLALNDDGRAAAPNGHAVPSWLGHLASLEQGASQLWAFEPVVVHGLVQTAAYAVAVESVGPGTITADDVTRKVENRLARQAVLTRRPDPLALSLVLDESVLRRRAGSDEVMAAQLDHLADVSQRPNVDLRVLPLDAGVFAAAFGSFTLFASAGSPDPYMACVEDKAGPHYLDRPPEVEAHLELFRYLSGVALPPADTVDLLRTIAKETYRP